MASDNMAVDVVDVDAMSVHEMEAGLGSSRMQLLQMEEQQAPSIRQSIQKSLTKSVRKAKYYLSFVFLPFKYLLSKFKLLILIVLYSCFGAWLFRSLEVPTDLAVKEEAYHARLIARDVMILNLRAIHLENREDREIRWKETVMQFENDVGLEEPSLDTVWTFWMSFLYAGTLYTTIGYGNIACQTRGGQIATIAYSFVGIPITLVLLNGLGDFLLKLTKFSAGFSADLFLFSGVRWGIIALEEGSEKRKRYQVFCSRLSKMKLISASSNLSIANEMQQEDVEHDPPVLSAIIMTILVMFGSAAIFTMLEGWDFFISWYFFFISCSTIGLGDVVPSKPEFMIIAMGLMLVGLAMVTVCFNVIQEKMERLFVEMMNKLMRDYMEALENNDPNATAGMMAGFQSKAKFLMPLMSKNTGGKAMEKFKKDCAEKGIEPPPVLTNIDPDTGMPAFATANKEDFTDFIEQAEEKQAEERRLVEERVQSRQSNLPEVRVSTVPVIESGVQVELMPLYAPRPEETTFGTQTFSPSDRSFGAQFTPPSMDTECQTDESTSIDEGIQTWPSSEEVSVQYDAVTFATCSVQYEYPELTTSTAAGIEPEFTSTGIQPEVSMFAVSDDSDLDTMDIESSEEEEETLEEKLNQLTLPTIQRLRKSVSEESQDTVVSVSPSMSPTSKRKKLEEKKNKKKKMRAEGLRFMKHSADQTSVEVLSMEVQTDYHSTVSGVQCQAETSEQALQITAEKKGRRCQTRITCIPVEKQNLGIGQEYAKGTLKRLLTQPSNVSTEPSQSVPSFEALAKHPSLQSIDESIRSGLDVDLSEGEVANLNVSLISKPVDEEGAAVFEVRSHYYVDEPSIAESAVTGASIGDDIFDSEDEFFDDEDMEFFVLNECTQTDDLLRFDDIETQASIADFDILKEVICQTELSSFRIQQKGVEEQKTPVDVTSTDISEEGPNIIEQEVTRGIMESSVQTATTMVYVGERGEEEQILIAEEEGVQYLVDSGCNPDYDGIAVSCQTEAPTTSTPISTVPVTVESAEQTDIKEETEIAVQVGFELLDVATQHEVDVEEKDIQACVETTEVETIAVESHDVSTGTFVETTDCEAQTSVPTSHTGIQHLNEFYRPHGAQTMIESSNAETQIELEVLEVEAQTEEEEPVSTSEAETQTDPKNVRKKETSVATAPDTKASAAAAVKEHAPSGVDATTPMVSTQAQSDVSMFVVDPSDRSRLEVEHAVRFNVDNGTWMEEKRLKSLGTQKDVPVHSSGVQVRPNLVTSHTQYVFSCASDQHSQTEIMTKNKRSQEVDASVGKTSTGIETEDVEEALPAPTGILWSDFDPVIEEWDDDDQASQLSKSSKASKERRSSVRTEVLGEASTRNEQEATTASSETASDIQESSEKHSEAVQGTSQDPAKKKVKKNRKIVKHDAGCSASPETEEAEMQASVEVETKACGLEEQEDWVKVYVQELDEERRNRMFDIGIQTGVLARVQHMYGRKEVATEEGGNVDILKVSLRKTDSTETLSKKKHEGSQESLSHASSVRSITESIDDNPTTWPGTSSSSKPKSEVKRSTSMKKPAKKKDRGVGEVAETIRRFERRNAPEEKRPRSSSSER